MEPISPAEQWLTVADICRAQRCDASTLRRRIRAGQFPPLKSINAKAVGLTRQAYLDWLESLPTHNVGAKAA